MRSRRKSETESEVQTESESETESEVLTEFANEIESEVSFGKLNDAPFFRLNETFLGIDSRYSAKYLQGFPHTV